MASSADSETEVNLTPLLDLVLQLIMFFMITVNFVQADQFPHGIFLPVAQSAMVMDKTADVPVFLNLNHEGKLVGTQEGFGLDTFGKVQVHLKQLRNAKVIEHGEDVRIVVVLRADQNCRYRKVHEVLEACQRAGYNNWQIRVMSKGG
jgi:biopolymer transport protein ExbD